jgi:hypothetical protein
MSGTIGIRASCSIRDRPKGHFARPCKMQSAGSVARTSSRPQREERSDRSRLCTGFLLELWKNSDLTGLSPQAPDRGMRVAVRPSGPLKTPQSALRLQNRSTARCSRERIASLRFTDRAETLERGLSEKSEEPASLQPHQSGERTNSLVMLVVLRTSSAQRSAGSREKRPDSLSPFTDSHLNGNRRNKSVRFSGGRRPLTAGDISRRHGDRIASLAHSLRPAVASPEHLCRQLERTAFRPRERRPRTREQ